VTALVVLILMWALLAAAWVGLDALLARRSGWSALAARYRGRPSSVAAPLRNAIVRMGQGTTASVVYNRSLVVAVGDDGIGLRAVPPFGVASRPLLIPWDALEPRPIGDRGGAPAFKVTVRDPRVTIVFERDAARRVRDAWRARAAGH